MMPLRRTLDRGLKATPAAVALLVMLACVPSVSAREDATASFRVTVSAQLTKTWDYVDTRESGGCDITDRVRGRRTVTLTSSRPTLVRVSGSASRVRFGPAAVGSVTARTRQEGSVATSQRGQGCPRAVQRDCGRGTRTLANQSLRFFRSGRNEVSFRRRVFDTPASCPPEDAVVREEELSLHQAEGELAERDFFNRAIRTLTAGGRSEQTIDVDGGPTGKIVVRVRWTLTFRRV